MATEAQTEYIENLLEQLDITFDDVLERINYPVSNIDIEDLDPEIASEVIDELKSLQRQRK